MANALNKDLTGRVVIIRAQEMKPEYAEPHLRAFRVDDGFGAKPYTAGQALLGEFLADGEQCRLEGWRVERFATDEEIEAAAKELIESRGAPSPGSEGVM